MISYLQDVLAATVLGVGHTSHAAGGHAAALPPPMFPGNAGQVADLCFHPGHDFKLLVTSHEVRHSLASDAIKHMRQMTMHPVLHLRLEVACAGAEGCTHVLLCALFPSTSLEADLQGSSAQGEPAELSHMSAGVAVGE